MYQSITTRFGMFVLFRNLILRDFLVKSHIYCLIFSVCVFRSLFVQAFGKSLVYYLCLRMLEERSAAYTFCPSRFFLLLGKSLRILQNNSSIEHLKKWSFLLSDWFQMYLLKCISFESFYWCYHGLWYVWCYWSCSSWCTKLFW